MSKPNEITWSPPDCIRIHLGEHECTFTIDKRRAGAFAGVEGRVRRQAQIVLDIDPSRLQVSIGRALRSKAGMSTAANGGLRFKLVKNTVLTTREEARHG